MMKKQTKAKACHIHVVQTGVATRIAHIEAWTLALQTELGISPSLVSSALAVAVGAVQVVWVVWRLNR